ncbi:cAMP-specific 3',5'-cyclic phosphodiesterase [Hondaea fermentalgiana]|uniref:cAMP-specific 3',5'-cyclic phosphodiesterase n=1 Tax=Hondaea fermentalgiana TaxID=2315210 RepID=A0A2R5GTU6_9STRA|nr:cAMP-specific 3',5'-cyclic phosphodiesterase [Hondaea fermentalgiana]|eukprot:GBG32063.1 cAMP-specific 3',5'-cyclic phosphodiesterase [Hondaea fermentalgiana]
MTSSENHVSASVEEDKSQGAATKPDSVYTDNIAAFIAESLHFDHVIYDSLAIPTETLVFSFSRALYDAAVCRQGLQDEITLADIECFVRCTSRFYKDQNPFHNFHHACSVTQAVYCLVSKLSIFSPRERLLLCLIALCHDAGHLGLSNRYLAQRFGNEVASTSPSASTPSASSSSQQTAAPGAAVACEAKKSSDLPAEVEEEKFVAGNISNNSIVDDAASADGEDDEDGKAAVAAAKACLRNPISDPREVVSRNGTMSTMEKHHVKIAHKIFRHHPALLRAVSKMPSGHDPRTEASAQEVSAYVLVTILCTDLAVHDTLLSDLARVDEGETSLRSKLRLAALIMHCADLSNPSRPFEVNYEWSIRLDEERRLLEESGESSAPNEPPSVSKFARGEVGFIQRFIEPSWVQFAETNAETRAAATPWLNALRANVAEWKRLAEINDDIASRPASERRRRSISSLGNSTASFGSELDDLASADSSDSKHGDVTCACAENPGACTCADTRALQLACTRSFIMQTPATQICCTILERECDRAPKEVVPSSQTA